MSKINLSDLSKILSNYTYVIGVDEVGLGAIAGELRVAAVKAPVAWSIQGLNDSKKMTPKAREKLHNILISLQSIQYATSFYEAMKIDSFSDNNKNVGNALRELYLHSINQLDLTDSIVVLDGIHKLDNINNVSLPKADSNVPTVMAASIIAKVIRDSKMKDLSKIYPDYEFDIHKGYPTPKHLELLKRYGPSEIHRFCYEPVKQYKKQNVI